MARRSRLRRGLDRWLFHPLEAVLAKGLFCLFGWLGLTRASDFGGWIGRTIGPRLSSAGAIRQRIALTLPDLTPDQVRQVAVDAWDNLGRTLAEYAHLATLRDRWGDHVEQAGGQPLADAAAQGGSCIAVTGHFGNWELAALACYRAGLNLTFVFRRPNNAIVADLLERARAPLGGTMVPKGRAAARGLATAMRRGDAVGLLVDQKLNEGAAIPFLGRLAMTGTVAADLALRFGAPVIPIRVRRLRDDAGRLTARFAVTVLPPLDLAADPVVAMSSINDLLGDWVRDDPGQWLWQHRRWRDT